MLLALVFIGLIVGLKKAFGEADMPGAQFLRSFVFIPAMAALITGCLPLLRSLAGTQTWGRRILKIFAVVLLVALTLSLGMCSLAFDVRFT